MIMRGGRTVQLPLVNHICRELYLGVNDLRYSREYRTYIMYASHVLIHCKSEVTCTVMQIYLGSNTKFSESTVSHIHSKAFQDLWTNERLLNVIEQFIGPEIAGHPVWNLRTKVRSNQLQFYMLI